MARIRTVKPDFWDDETVAALSLRARLLFIATWNFADDEGLLRWTPDYVKASAFMYDQLTAKQVKQVMVELEDAGLVVAYTAGKQQLAHLPNFLKHQRINRPQPSKFPHPPWMNDSVNGSLNDHGTLTEPSPPEWKGREEEEEKESSSSSRDTSPAHPTIAADDEEGAFTEEARRRLLGTTSDVVDPTAWVRATARRLKAEGWTPPTTAPPPTCRTCNDLPLEDGCPDCSRSASA